MQCILSALKAEAVPLIDHFKLRKDAKFPFPLYQNNNLCLLIIGVGKKKIEERISAIYNYHGLNHLQFLNIGISGGHPINSKKGQIYIINKIVDDQTGHSFFPDILIDNKIEENSITTVDKTINDGRKDYKNLVDMEASEIFKSCIKKVSTHQISFLKIVSDYMGEDTFLLSNQIIKELIKDHIDTIQLFLTNISKIQKKIKPILSNNDNDWIENLRIKLNLTETQYYQLISICKGYRLKNPSLKFEDTLLKKPSSKQERDQTFRKTCEFLKA